MRPMQRLLCNLSRSVGENYQDTGRSAFGTEFAVWDEGNNFRSSDHDFGNTQRYDGSSE